MGTKTTALILILALALTAAPAASAREVSGTWSNPVGACVAEVLQIDPEADDFRCRGTSRLTGTWRGTATWLIIAKRDPATGALSGHLLGMLKGKRRGYEGTLIFLGSITIDAEGRTDIRSRVLQSWGIYAGSTGRAHWTGTTNLADGSGSGTYSGHWKPPARR